MHHSINKKHKYITVGSKVHKTDAVQMKGNHNTNQGLIVFNEPVMQETNTNNDTPVVVDISTTGLWQPTWFVVDINVIHHITKKQQKHVASSVIVKKNKHVLICSFNFRFFVPSMFVV